MNSSWFKFPVSYWDDPRLFRLKRLLGDDALCVPIKVWSYAVSHAQDGDLSQIEAEELAYAIRFDGDASKMIEALTSAGFIDENGCLADWEWMFALPRSRTESARKAGLKSGENRRKKRDKKEEIRTEERRGECHVERDVERDVQSPSPDLVSCPYSSWNELPSETRDRIERRYRLDDGAALGELQFAQMFDDVRTKSVRFRDKHTAQDWAGVLADKLGGEAISKGAVDTERGRLRKSGRREFDDAW